MILYNLNITVFYFFLIKREDILNANVILVVLMP